MARGSHHCKVDNVQPEILKQLIKAEISYKPVHMVKGFVDLVVGYNGVNYLFEINNEIIKQERLIKNEKM